MDDAALMATWRLMQGERELFADSAGRDAAVGHAEPLVPPPRAADGVPARAGVPIPSIYGPSADENPFA